MRFSRVFKRDWRQFKIQLARHRKFQIVITSGVVGTTVVSFMAPHQQELIIVAATATNLVWIWE